MIGNYKMGQEKSQERNKVTVLVRMQLIRPAWTSQNVRNRLLP